MTAEHAREVLLWCVLINYGVLILWFVALLSAHDLLYRLHARWFRISVEAFDTVHYGGLAIYKIGILLLNLVPYVALTLVA
ncbi:MAG: uncharacterized protein JWQ90_4777 [Hydrocarboniphaga sp.]|uniref:DUF6868 family protein n=1 Tax=Hydrocarboniphaga sp. TaxID=2033016 RepID=UPI002626D05E|nr:hypothetical protein [Hydrocarboniphaga sp.]MDB5972327.1 uncharacterized protein [Hydrocarboniphaga sp.]